MRLADGVVVARVDGREAAAVAIQDEPGERLARRRIAGARLEVDEVAGGERRRPPGRRTTRAVRTRNGAAPRSRAAGRRSVEGDPARLGRGQEALPCPVAGSTRASWRTTPTPGPFGAADPLARRLGDRLEDRVLIGAGTERQRDPVARRLDLLDRVEARRPRSPRGTPVSASGTSGSAATTSIPSAASSSPIATRRAARTVGAAASASTGPGPRGMYALPPPTSGHGRVSASARPPSSSTRNRGRQPEPLAMRRPGPRLVDVAAGRLDRARIPVLRARPGCASRTFNRPPRTPRHCPPAPTPPRRRDHWTRTRWAIS